MNISSYLRHIETRRPGPFAHLATRAIIAAISPLQRYRVTGPGSIPSSGAALVVANHISYIDPVLLNAYIYRQKRVPHILTKSGLFKPPVAGHYLRSAHAIPLGRKGQDQEAMRTAKSLLQQGELVMIFPEGTSAKDEAKWPIRSKTGAAWLALETGVPVTPISQWGAQAILNTTDKGTKFSPFPLRKPIDLRIGEPMDFSDRMDDYRATPGAVLREVAHSIMTQVTRGLEVVRGIPAEGYYAAENSYA